MHLVPESALIQAFSISLNDSTVCTRSSDVAFNPFHGVGYSPVHTVLVRLSTTSTPAHHAGKLADAERGVAEQRTATVARARIPTTARKASAAHIRCNVAVITFGRVALVRAHDWDLDFPRSVWVDPAVWVD